MRLQKRIKRNLRCFGGRGVGLALRELFTRDPLPLRVRSPHLGTEVTVRLNTTDISIYDQMFVQREYELPLVAAPDVIVDAGANIGFSVLYFARKYPEARIIALEPERSNFELLQRNTAGLPNVTIQQKALWHEVADLGLFDAGPGRAGLQKDGFQTFASEENRANTGLTVPAVDLDTLMAEQGIEFIDLLKIDVEGAEREVFRKGGRWLGRVGVMVVELHDRMRPGCSRAFYTATAAFEQEIYRGGKCHRRHGRPTRLTAAARRTAIAHRLVIPVEKALGNVIIGIPRHHVAVAIAGDFFP